MAETLLVFWPYHMVNYVLAVAMYMLLGQFVLQLFFAPDAPQVIWRVFVQTTRPLVTLIRALTPAFVTDGLLPLVGIFWLALARFLFWLFMATQGWAPAALT